MPRDTRHPCKEGGQKWAKHVDQTFLSGSAFPLLFYSKNCCVIDLFHFYCYLTISLNLSNCFQANILFHMNVHSFSKYLRYFLDFIISSLKLSVFLCGLQKKFICHYNSTMWGKWNFFKWKANKKIDSFSKSCKVNPELTFLGSWRPDSPLCCMPFS